MDYSELREIHRCFYFHDYQISETTDELHIVFDFEIEGLSHFNPDFTLSKPEGAPVLSELRVFREAAFSLGLIELVSYWKITCPPLTVIECGSLDEKQISWWKKLYFNGLGDFFCRNNIEADPERFMEIRTLGEMTDGREDKRVYKGNLIPVGGGKDSFVSLELLSGMREENHAFVISHVMSAIHSSQAAGYRGDRLIIAERSLDPRMLEFNRQGYLNGHTPFSALAAFASLITAIVYGKKYICLSNDASVSDPAGNDTAVTRLYSKTFAFEKDFREYAREYLTGDIQYFSLLRPLNELQTAGIFSTYPQYFRVFRSCSVGQKTESWCGRCEKCLFVCIMLSAFVDDDVLRVIFGREMLDDAQMRPLFEELSGITDDNPSACSGVREEVSFAVCMSIRRHEEAGRKLPLLYEIYRDSAYYEYYKDRDPGLDAWNAENTVPEEYKALIREKLKAVFG